jgi:hypothetical protein
LLGHGIWYPIAGARLSVEQVRFPLRGRYTSLVLRWAGARRTGGVAIEGGELAKQFWAALIEAGARPVATSPSKQLPD